MALAQPRPPAADREERDVQPIGREVGHLGEEVGIAGEIQAGAARHHEAERDGAHRGRHPAVVRRGGPEHDVADCDRLPG
jgi:hypothetical protein